MLNSDIPGWISTIHAQATAAALSVTRDLPRSSPTFRPRTHLRLVLGRSEYASAVKIFDGVRREIPSKIPSQIPSEIPLLATNQQPRDTSTARKHFTLDDRVPILTFVILTLDDRVIGLHS
ncbi:hypothetical protein H0G86_000298 [Trichoderma simmonsii]|uniref:Uncharacterized protein n=1 Tax=Trichoderma simmonsii TaxID=1491479 RepID=A0A8G0KZE0_9HYPO|nr:hypothetical protein H0G86_000298 [Trichoderma simmonsii]